MAGHSKWANIQHRKKAQDAKRGKLFTRLIREITVAARLGDINPESNSRLRLAIDKAIAANMPKDSIERAIKRGCGEIEGAVYENINYEGYGPGGVAILVECTTDNKNRSVSEIRHAFARFGGNLGTSGSVSYLFKQHGVLSYPPDLDEEAILEAATLAGADDIENEHNIEILTKPENLLKLKQAMTASGYEPNSAEIEMRPTDLVPLNGSDSGKLINLLEALENCDDVQNVYCNAGFTDTTINDGTG
ncbi:MAG: YebC/PmpR family DNA-binding transcriptional regulator [Chromatiales bacterium]|nr:YebC/PmpR family DNA-binding transcriptional regulator [Chromatiales bacterium]